MGLSMVRGGRPPRLVVGLAVGAVALGLVAGCGGGRPAGASAGGGPFVIAGGNGKRPAATLDVVNGTTTVRVSARALGGDLYRVSTPAGSGIRPLVTERGSVVEVGQTASTGAKTAVADLDIAVTSGVRWTINLDGGATTESVDMAGGSLSALDFGAGVSMASVQLPAPAGTQTVTLAGGASQLLVTAPAGPPAQVEAMGGASQVVLDGVAHTGVAGGSVFSDADWAVTHDRYAIDLTAGVSDFRLTRT
jgi:hypothetical protein